MLSYLYTAVQIEKNIWVQATVYGQNGDTKTATNQNGDTAIRRRPERRQTEMETNQNGDTASQNGDTTV